MGLASYRGSSFSFAACTHWPNTVYCNIATSNNIYSVQSPFLYNSLFLLLCLHICFCPNISLSISLLLSFYLVSFFLPPPSLACRPDCCRALTEKKHSEIWHCIIMPQTCTYHSLAAALLSSPALKLWLSVLLRLLTLTQLVSDVRSLSTACENRWDSHVDACRPRTTEDCG